MTTGGAASARAKAAAMRKAEQDTARRRRTLIQAGAVLVVLAVVVVVGVIVQAQRDRVDGTAAPSGVADDGGFTVGTSDAPVRVEIYEDFQCPACAAFEQQTAPTLAELVDAGTARLTYHPIAFLDRASTDRYSTRALNAVACVIDSAPEAFPTYHDSLFAEQPAEGGPGLSDDRLVALAVGAGAEEHSVQPCVQELRYEDWTRRVTDAASRAGINQTPTVLIDDEPLTDWSPVEVRTAVEAALNQ